MTIQNPLVRLHEQFLEIRLDLDTVFHSDAAGRQRIGETERKLAKDAEEGQLSTLVFGHYNAGKSTFINALLGRESAVMGDVPLTGEIKPYEWNGHVLFDSPGIDAPIEHEEITDGFIQRECNAVIYVIATGGAVEEAATWQRLCKFIREKKAVLIVINDKAGLELNGPEFVRIRSTVYANMQQAAKVEGLDDPLDKIEVLHVKARTALKAQVENKPGLLAKTGLLEAQAVLTRFLNASTEKIVDSNRERVRLLVNAAIEKLTAQSGDAAAIQLVAGRSKVEQERTRLESALVESTRMLVAGEVNALHTRVASIGPASGVDVGHILEDALARSQQRLGIGVERLLATELDRTDHIVLEAAQLLAQQVNKSSVSVDDIQLTMAEILQNEAAQGSANGIASSVFETLKSMPVDKLTESGVKEALQLGKQWFPKFFKGIGQKTMGKWAGAAGKAAGPVLIVGQAAYELYSAHKEEAQAREQHRQFVVGVMDTVKQAFSDALNQYELMFKKIARSTMDPVLEALDKHASLLQSQDLARHKMHERLSTWTRDLD